MDNPGLRSRKTAAAEPQDQQSGSAAAETVQDRGQHTPAHIAAPEEG